LLKKATYLTLLLSWIFIQRGISQHYTDIGSDTLNRYAAIDTIYNFTDSVATLVMREAGDLDKFHVGDTVMVYCIKGSEIDMDPASETVGKRPNGPVRNHGRYAFLIINAIDTPRKLIRLNNHMPTINPMVEGESAQLIRVHSFRRARVNSTLTVPAWDPDLGYGGVLALFVERTLVLDDDIDVSESGFRGGTDAVISDGMCAESSPADYDSLFYPTDGPVIKAGMKGEGITFTSFDYRRGKSFAFNGGGGGNGRLSGGGGGSNLGEGGKGGYESTDCDAVVDTRGLGGVPMDEYGYYNNDPFWGNRAYFGGGGGRGTNITGRTSSDGGSGGGLVVILANTIEGNDHHIRADGESIAGSPVNGAGGGGGGGGAILLDVDNFRNLNLSAVGGAGGNTNSSDTTGPGGGGGLLACRQQPSRIQ